MKICYLANAQSVHTQKWVRFFADKGHEIYLISFEKDHVENVRMYNLKRPFGLRLGLDIPFRFVRAQAIKRLIERIDPDILHAHYLVDYGLYGAFCGFKPFVVTAWGSDALFIPSEGLRKYMVKRLISKYVISKADLVTADSESLLNAVIIFGVPREKVKLIGHGVNLNVFHPSVGNEKLKEKLKIPVSCPVVISTRSLEPIYDVETLIKAIPIVLRSNDNVYFVIVGGGSSKTKLEMTAGELGVSNRVRFVGRVSQMEVAELLGMSDVYVSTALSDSTPVSLLEAMACCLPVVITDLEATREWIRDGVNGFFIRSMDFRALADRILFLLENRNVGRKFGSVSMRIVKEKADYEKEMGKMEQLYRKLAEV